VPAHVEPTAAYDATQSVPCVQLKLDDPSTHGPGATHLGCPYTQFV
jgi:hypothetical protein